MRSSRAIAVVLAVVLVTGSASFALLLVMSGVRLSAGPRPSQRE